MKLSAKQLMMAAAVTGLLGGTTARLQASPATASTTVANGSNQVIQADSGKVSVHTVAYGADDKAKHSCKGKNDCKGQGGCKSSANGCKGKNDCKGQGGCATDGSKPPSNA